MFLLQGTFPTPPVPVSPSEDFGRLLRDAAEGLPVAGRVPTWEADRPKTLAVGEPVKVRSCALQGQLRLQRSRPTQQKNALVQAQVSANLVRKQEPPPVTIKKRCRLPTLLALRQGNC